MEKTNDVSEVDELHPLVITGNVEAHRAFTPMLRNTKDYQAARQVIIAAREGFFQAVRAYMRPEQRKDAKALSDRLWNSAARTFSASDFVYNAERGYMTIKEHGEGGRHFRLSILQMGHILRLGVRIPKKVAVLQVTVTDRIAATFSNNKPIQVTLSSGDVLFDWEFNMPKLYDCALTMETAIYMVGHLFENTLQAVLAPQKNDTSYL